MEYARSNRHAGWQPTVFVGADVGRRDALLRHAISGCPGAEFNPGTLVNCFRDSIDE